MTVVPTVSWARGPAVKVGAWLVVHRDRTWHLDVGAGRRVLRLQSPGYHL